jgi:hypothetical protein
MRRACELGEQFWGNYRKCFPTDFEFIVTETPERYLERFYQGKAISEEGEFVY